MSLLLFTALIIFLYLTYNKLDFGRFVYGFLHKDRDEKFYIS